MIHSHPKQTADEVFGLDKEAISAIVARALDEEVANFHMELWIRKGDEIAGINSDTEIMTVHTEQRKPINIFVKRQKHPDKYETRHYAGMKNIGINTPQLYGSLKDPAGHETLFLEHLEQPVIDISDPLQLKEAICVIARINYSNPPPEYRHTDAIKSFNDELLKYRSSISDFYEEIEHHHEKPIYELRKQRAHLEAIIEKIRIEFIQHPFSLNLRDAHFQNFGWKKSTSEVVIFDLEGFGLAPRFLSIREFIHRLGNWDRCCWTARRMIEVYLTEYRTGTDEALSYKLFRKEAHACLAVHALRQLEYEICLYRKSDQLKNVQISNILPLQTLLRWRPIQE